MGCFSSRPRATLSQWRRRSNGLDPGCFPATHGRERFALCEGRSEAELAQGRVRGTDASGFGRSSQPLGLATRQTEEPGQGCSFGACLAARGRRTGNRTRLSPDWERKIGPESGGHATTRKPESSIPERTAAPQANGCGRCAAESGSARPLEDQMPRVRSVA